MRYLGIDHGEKRIGLALSDQNGRIAMPYRTLLRTKNIFKEIAAIVRKEQVQEIVLGLPVPFSGGESGQSKKVKKFAEKLNRLVRLPLSFENELFTTKIAERGGIPRKHLDAASATLILQSYIDKQSPKS